MKQQYIEEYTVNNSK